MPSQTLREALDADPRSRRQIAHAAGIEPSTITRLMQGKAIMLDNLDALAGALDLELMQRSRKRRSPVKAAPTSKRSTAKSGGGQSTSSKSKRPSSRSKTSKRQTGHSSRD